MSEFYSTKIMLNADVSKGKITERQLKINFARLICDRVIGFVSYLLLMFVLL